MANLSKEQFDLLIEIHVAIFGTPDDRENSLFAKFDRLDAAVERLGEVAREDTESPRIEP